MANKYEFGDNPIQDFLLQSIIYGLDISKPEFFNDVYSGIAFILSNIIENENNVSYLDFDIINKDGHYKIIGNNVISAMWLSGHYPFNIQHILTNDEFEFNNKLYKFNKKTKKLTHKTIKNGK